MASLHYKDLIVWQKSIDLAEKIYILTNSFPTEEIYGITSQMRRASVSIPSNIAEGQERNSVKEFVHFLLIAQGSRAELETQLILCKRLGYISDESFESISSICREIGKMVNVLINKLQNK